MLPLVGIMSIMDVKCDLMVLNAPKDVVPCI